MRETIFKNQTNKKNEKYLFNLHMLHVENNIIMTEKDKGSER